MNNKIRLILSGVMVLLTMSIKAAVTVHPKIMVIPYVKETEDIRTILEEDVNKRIVLTKVKEAFDSRGFTTVDFTGKLKSLSTQGALASEHQQDLKSAIITNSGADIYVEAEIVVGLTSSGNSVKVIVNGYDASTGSSLANKVGDSGKFYTDDISRLGAKAIESCAEDFLNVMQLKFNDVVENGRSINVTIGFDGTSAVNMTSEIGDEGLTLADAIELWLGDHAFKGNYHLQGTTSNKMIIDDVRIPLKTDSGANYNINRFGLEFLKFARGNGLKINRDISGNSLIITIL